MHSKSLVLATISSTAMAAQLHRGHHHWHGSGTGWWPRPTGGWGGDYNVTTTIEYTSTIYSTVTVTPAEASTSASAAVTTGKPVADATVNGEDDDGEDCEEETVTATSVQYVTTTAAAAASSSPVADAPAAPASSTSSAAVVDATSTSSSSVAAGGFYGSSTAYPTASASTTSAAASSASSTPASSGDSSGTKRGVPFNNANMISPFGSSISWIYNWGATCPSGISGVEFVPMMWGANSVSNFASSVPSSAKAILSFNEPDLGSQSNLDPATAAQLHIQGTKSLVGKVRIGSPAVTNGGGSSMGIGWLNQFFTACAGQCNIDFVAFHWYADANIDYLTSHVSDLVQASKDNNWGVSKFWLTEFAPQGSDSANAAFMTQAVQYLDNNANIERYAAFMASDGTLMSGNALNSVGKAYIAA